jgi:hypothetical protein
MVHQRNSNIDILAKESEHECGFAEDAGVIVRALNGLVSKNAYLSEFLRRSRFFASALSMKNQAGHLFLKATLSH